MTSNNKSLCKRPLMRARFRADDVAPVVWPIELPCWETGVGFSNDGEYVVVVAYVRGFEELFRQWPEASDVEVQIVTEIKFSSRFSKPEWYSIN
ncbi:MAG: hypothetical protein DRR16_15465 [Candidatus Parabeggiatoa sp. nov. 3]|nr:MAG: hypothetical protein DRR16_15465 [Gammaproteobacteria bacterium]